MKIALFLLAVASFTACNNSNGKSNSERLTGASDIPILVETGLEDQVAPEFSEQAFLKENPESLVECKSAQTGGFNCRLVSKSIILEENPTNEDRLYEVKYDNKCRRKGVANNAEFASGIVVRSQPEGDGEIYGSIKLNEASTFRIRGNGDLRIELLTVDPMNFVFEEGCSLNVSFSRINLN